MSLWQDFLTNDDLAIHKWTHYFPAYERHFGRFRNLDVTMLEIGVAQGGSLRMWKRFLGPYAKIVGIDINPACKAAEEEQIGVRIGSQADPAFLENLLAEFGVPDIVLDDGSHQMSDVNATFDFLFPRLGKNSIYAVEDLHTAYWPEYGGGLAKPGTFIERSKHLIDQLNADQTRGQLQPDKALAGLSSIHCYESMVILEKIAMGRRHAPRGRPAALEKVPWIRRRLELRPQSVAYQPAKKTRKSRQGWNALFRQANMTGVCLAFVPRSRFADSALNQVPRSIAHPFNLRTSPMLTAARTCLTVVLLLPLAAASARAEQNAPPARFTALFNGKDFTGWYGMEGIDPRKLAAMTDEQRAAKRAKDMEDLNKHWKVENGELVNDGNGVYMTTDKDYGDIELYVDYKMYPKGDSGIYLRGTPQVQIWDYTEAGGKWKIGADKGSGGLWNNKPGSPGKDPLVLADKPFGEWNTFHIVQIGARTTVYLNDKLVVDNAPLENYWEKTAPLFAKGPIQLQTHGSEIRWRNVFVREIPASEANEQLAKYHDESFESVFNGKDLTGWEGPLENYEVVDGAIRCRAGKGGTIYTSPEYGDFVARLEFKLPPGGNNGLAIRYPGKGDTAYVGMCELQVLDSDAPKYAKIDPRQSHGSAYGMAPAARGYLRPVGEWNFQEVTVRGPTIKVELNGNVILDTDLSKITEYMANSAHPGKDLTKGHFGFAGHSDPVEFRNIRIKRL